MEVLNKTTVSKRVPSGGGGEYNYLVLLAKHGKDILQTNGYKVATMQNTTGKSLGNIVDRKIA